MLVIVDSNRHNRQLQQLRRDVVKGVIAYVKTTPTDKFFGPCPVDFTDTEFSTNIYNKGFPDSSIYVYPKVTQNFAYNKAGFERELHLGVAKQFFEAFAVRGECIASLYCGGGTGAAAAMLLGLNSVSVDIEERQVMRYIA